MRRFLFPIVPLLVVVLLGAGLSRAGYDRGYDDGFADGAVETAAALEAADGTAPVLQVVADERRPGGGFLLLPLLLLGGFVLLGGRARRRAWREAGPPRERLERWHDEAHARRGPDEAPTPTGSPPLPDGPSWPDRLDD